MVTYSLVDPRNGKVFYVGEAGSLHKAVGNLLLRPPESIRGVLASLEQDELLPTVRSHDWETKKELLAKHVRTVRNAGRSGPESKAVTLAGFKYSEKLRSRLSRMGVKQERLVALGPEIAWRGAAKARAQLRK